jgi:TonB family protein
MATQASDTANSTASKRGRGASPDDLAVVAQRAQAFTNASGVAIALSEGNADEIVCRARSGASAPDVGAALRVNGTFTGLCIQSGKELRCDDCETDTRVDTAAIRALGIRSMVVTPIREDSRVIGVLAAFAPTPHAFTITHVAVLKTMADQISALLQKDRRVREEAPQAEAPRPAAPAISAKPVVTPAPAPVVPPAVVIKPSAPAPRAAAPVVSKVEPVKSMPVEVVPLATPPKKEERRAEVAPRASFGTFDSVVAEEKKPGSRFVLIGVVAVLGIAAAGTFTVLKLQKSGSQAPAQHAQEAAITQPVQPAAAAPAGNAQPGAANANVAVPSVSNASGPASTSRAAAEIDARKTPGKTTPEKTSNASADKPTPAERPAAVTTLSASAQSRIAQQAPAQPAPEIAPSFTVASGNAPSLSNLARPVATSTPSAGAIEQSQLEPLLLTRSVPPVYPAIAKARSITGTVIVQATVGKDGKATNLQFISGPPIFKDAAFDAVRQYQFKPAKLNGQPIEQVTQVKLIFK